MVPPGPLRTLFIHLVWSSHELRIKYVPIVHDEPCVHTMLTRHPGLTLIPVGLKSKNTNMTFWDTSTYLTEMRHISF